MQRSYTRYAIGGKTEIQVVAEYLDDTIANRTETRLPLQPGEAIPISGRTTNALGIQILNSREIGKVFQATGPLSPDRQAEVAERIARYLPGLLLPTHYTFSDVSPEHVNSRGERFVSLLPDEESNDMILDDQTDLLEIYEAAEDINGDFDKLTRDIDMTMIFVPDEVAWSKTQDRIMSALHKVLPITVDFTPIPFTS